MASVARQRKGTLFYSFVFFFNPEIIILKDEKVFHPRRRRERKREIHIEESIKTDRQTDREKVGGGR